MRGAGLSVLVAEDEPLAGEVLAEILSAEGHDVHLAANGRAALGLARCTGIDVLVTDLCMPVMGGLELIATLRRRSPLLPVIVMTGYLAPGTLAQLSEAGPPPLDILHKPFEVGRLVALLDQLRRTAALGARRLAAAE